MARAFGPMSGVQPALIEGVVCPQWSKVQYEQLGKSTHIVCFLSDLGSATKSLAADPTSADVDIHLSALHSARRELGDLRGFFSVMYSNLKVALICLHVTR